MPHVIIVGSGMAAIAAGFEASEGGAEVTLIRGRPGATALSSGAVDVAGCPTRHPGMRWHEFPPPSENFREIVRRSPRHPYARLSQNERLGEIPPFLERSLNRLAVPLGLRFRGSVSKNLFLLNPLGGVKPTAFSLHSQWGGNLLEMREANLLIVGFRGLPSFSAPQAAAFLKELHERQGFPYLSRITSVELALKGLASASTPVDLAMRLDQESMIETLHDALLREAERGGTTHVALAPVIGIEKTDHILSRLMETTRLHWFETLGLPPSLPGLRLQRAIDRFLKTPRPRWSIVEGRATGAIVKNRRITSLRILKKEGEKEDIVNVDHLLLATGRSIGGGIIREKEFREPILNLPLFSDEGSPLFSIGVKTNYEFQPVGDRGRLLYENLWVAGSLLGGYDPATEHCGLGVAVGTGTLAGRMAAT